MQIQNDGDAKDILNRVVCKLYQSLGVTFDDIMNEFMQYKETHGPYSPKEVGEIVEVVCCSTSCGISYGDKLCQSL